VTADRRPRKPERLPDAEAREIIATDLDSTIVVEAAAGTGKTTALVSRILRVIEAGHEADTIDRIVAVTFTEKAAGELKLRLREALEDARTARGGSSAARADVQVRLDAALARLEEAHVGTIHAFCADLLRERPVEARVDPLFTVLTEPQAGRLYNEAFHGWLQEQLAAPPEGVRRALKRSTVWSRAAPSAADEGPIDRLRNAGRTLVEWRDFPHPWTREPDFDRGREIERLVDEVHRFADLTEKPSYARDFLYLDTASVRHFSADLRRSSFDLDSLEARLVDLVHDRKLQRARHGRGPDYARGILRSSVISALDGLKASLDQFRAAADADLAALLQEELAGSIERYETLKARAGALDFLDLLLKTRDLLQGNAGVRQAFQRRFSRIFVDEFQDTDPLQAEILLLLASDPAGAGRVAAGKLFIVGDPKQSIYRFRRADVAVYRKVCEQLVANGARHVTLTTSFRSTPEIQAVVNAAFEPEMTGDAATLQADYVPLTPFRPQPKDRRSVVVLPVPEPYGVRNVSAIAIEKSLPDAVGAFIEWLVARSGWGVTPRDVCVLFRRFISFGDDITRPYVDALDARGIPHVLVGGKSFHEREEVETVRAALTAVEWPDDELSVFATIRGALFAIGDEDLLDWHERHGGFHPFRVPQVDDAGGADRDAAHLEPIRQALLLLQRLHRRRNYRSVADTLGDLLEATRAHVGFVLRSAGEQALANVLHVAELARQYELEGGISFRGFVEALSEAADTAASAEAPILEESSGGVRLMTVHKAKGLEFPVVILADLTCKLARADAGRWIDPDRKLCALRLGGWSPNDLLRQGPIEVARDQAEAVRLAYVAATRARDLLVVPAVGDGPYDGGWLDPLSKAIYPAPPSCREAQKAPGCPAFGSKDSVLKRPDNDPAQAATVAPGLHVIPQAPSPRAQAPGPAVVWWDPRALSLHAETSLGLRRDDLIVKDVDMFTVDQKMADYERWRASRDAALEQGSSASLVVRTVTELAHAPDVTTMSIDRPARPIEVVDLPRPAGRPSGPRFGTLVHGVLSFVALDAETDAIRALAESQARILGATTGEIDAAVQSVAAVLAHPLLDRARAAAGHDRLRRELPIVASSDAGLVEGTIDLFIDDDEGLVIDFKTDRDLDAPGAELDFGQYERQVAFYCDALGRLRGTPPRGVLMRI
jgi:ATP-dependent exoDNAse (exonuclease V) beta subunit